MTNLLYRAQNKAEKCITRPVASNLDSSAFAPGEVAQFAALQGYSFVLCQKIFHMHVGRVTSVKAESSLLSTATGAGVLVGRTDAPIYVKTTYKAVYLSKNGLREVLHLTHSVQLRRRTRSQVHMTSRRDCEPESGRHQTAAHRPVSSVRILCWHGSV